MGQVTLPGNPSVAIEIRRSRRARRLSLRVSSLDGRVTLTLPTHVSDDVGHAFIAEKAGWISQAIGKVPTDVAVRPGETIPLEGNMITIGSGSRKSAFLSDGRLLAPAHRTGIAVRSFLKATARDTLSRRVSAHAEGLGRTPGRLTLRDTRSRWGSCSSDGNLMFSWRLIMAPPHVLDYVAAHEVAHLEHMDHSRAFWDVVADLRPDWRGSRDWLRVHGATLHRYRFDGAP